MIREWYQGVVCAPLKMSQWVLNTGNLPSWMEVKIKMNDIQQVIYIAPFKVGVAEIHAGYNEEEEMSS